MVIVLRGHQTTDMYVKRFIEWIRLKKKLHVNSFYIPHVCENQIWWASIGENIGYEINGKSMLFTRPVIIFKKLTRGFYFVIPTSTQDKNGSWYVGFKHKGRFMVACLHQARTIDYRRLSTLIGEIDSSDAERIKLGFRKLYF